MVWYVDVLVLACTHYPLLIDKIREYIPVGTTIVSQGEIVANGLKDYLLRHPEMEERCSKEKTKLSFSKLNRRCKGYL